MKSTQNIINLKLRHKTAKRAPGLETSGNAIAALAVSHNLPRPFRNHLGEQPGASLRGTRRLLGCTPAAEHRRGEEAAARKKHS